MASNIDISLWSKKLVENMSAPSALFYGIKSINNRELSGKITVNRPSRAQYTDHAADAMLYAAQQPQSIAQQLRAKIPNVDFNDVNVSVQRDAAFDKNYLLLRRGVTTLAVELELLEKSNYDCPISEENLAKIVLIFG